MLDLINSIPWSTQLLPCFLCIKWVPVSSVCSITRCNPMAIYMKGKRLTMRLSWLSTVFKDIPEKVMVTICLTIQMSNYILQIYDQLGVRKLYLYEVDGALSVKWYHFPDSVLHGYTMYPASPCLQPYGWGRCIQFIHVPPYYTQ